MRVLLALVLSALPLAARAVLPEQIPVLAKTGPNAPFEKLNYQLRPAKKPWRICVVLPNVMDSYWWTVSYALWLAEKELKVDLTIEDAGGYTHLDAQKLALKRCKTNGAQAALVASISQSGLSAEINELLGAGIRVFDLINGLKHSRISGRSATDFKTILATLVGEVNARERTPKRKTRLAFFPGPKGAQWVEQSLLGLNETLAKDAFELKVTDYGATEVVAQAEIAENFFRLNAADVVLGNAVAVEFIANKYQQKLRAIYSTYLTEAIIQYIQNGRVKAAVTEFPMFQTLLAVDLAVRDLEGERKYFELSTIPQIVTKDYLATDPPWLMHPKSFRYYLKRKFTNPAR